MNTTPALPAIKHSGAVKRKESLPSLKYRKKPTNGWLRTNLSSKTRSHSFCQQQSAREISTQNSCTNEGAINVIGMNKVITCPTMRDTKSKLDYNKENVQSTNLPPKCVEKKRRSYVTLKPLVNIANMIRTHVTFNIKVPACSRKDQLIAKYMDAVPLTAWTVQESPKDDLSDYIQC